MEKNIYKIEKELFITSDEEIKEGDWCIYNTGEVIQYLVKINTDNLKKIVLTTDQDLNGVQAIDDEFLEWFVKNPSCEKVDIESFCKYGDTCQSKGAYDKQYLCDVGYKIIIPQEEIKRKIDTCYNFDMEIGCVQDICRCEQEEPKQETLTYTEAAKKEERIFNSTMMSKQETLEEAAEKYLENVNTKVHKDLERDGWIKIGFINGAKWKQERMYSEADKIMKFLDTEVELKLSDIKTIERIKWYFETYFEQFKKK
jgi:hypothetical protein